MAKRTFEDFKPGMIFTAGPRLVTREELIAFAAEFDPQPMHMDEEAGRASMLGGLGGSGWHTCCLLMRMICDSFLLDSMSMGSPGIDEVKWLAPLRPGSQLSMHAAVTDTKVSRSLPDRGFVKFVFEMRDQTGVAIMTLGCSLMIARRAGQAA